MTYRVYVRWPGQKTSHKTASESISIAQTAFDEITDNAVRFTEQGALGVTFTDNGKQLDYRKFSEAPDIRAKTPSKATRDRRRLARALETAAPGAEPTAPQTGAAGNSDGQQDAGPHSKS